MSRVNIGNNFLKQQNWKIYLGVPLIYLPLIVTIPFVLVGIFLVKLHLKLVGAKNVKPYWSFVPEWITHRYKYDNQIIYHTQSKWYHLGHYKFFWLFNCKLYCPLSVALFRYASYLVMIVENWWCPFHHEKKSEYQDGAIDQSYWHLYEGEKQRLHPDDLNNSIWNNKTKKH